MQAEVLGDAHRSVKDNIVFCKKWILSVEETASWGMWLLSCGLFTPCVSLSL